MRLSRKGERGRGKWEMERVKGGMGMVWERGMDEKGRNGRMIKNQYWLSTYTIPFASAGTL